MTQETKFEAGQRVWVDTSEYRRVSGYWATVHSVTPGGLVKITSLCGPVRYNRNDKWKLSVGEKANEHAKLAKIYSIKRRLAKAEFELPKGVSDETILRCGKLLAEISDELENDVV